MADDESEIQRLESLFPASSGSAFAAARAHVLASGQSVLQSEGGVIYRCFPNGRKEVVKEIEPPTVSMIGRKYTIP